MATRTSPESKAMATPTAQDAVVRRGAEYAERLPKRLPERKPALQAGRA